MPIGTIQQFYPAKAWTSGSGTMAYIIATHPSNAMLFYVFGITGGGTLESGGSQVSVGGPYSNFGDAQNAANTDYQTR
jgi:hypothetical protein